MEIYKVGGRYFMHREDAEIYSAELFNKNEDGYISLIYVE